MSTHSLIVFITSLLKLLLRSRFLNDDFALTFQYPIPHVAVFLILRPEAVLSPPRVVGIP